MAVLKTSVQMEKPQTILQKNQTVLLTIIPQL